MDQEATILTDDDPVDTEVDEMLDALDEAARLGEPALHATIAPRDAMREAARLRFARDRVREQRRRARRGDPMESRRLEVTSAILGYCVRRAERLLERTAYDPHIEHERAA